MPKGRGRKDSDSDAATDDNGTVGTFETLRDEGEHFVHVKQWEKAIESFSKALEMKPDDKTCLVVRAKCFLMLGNSEKALADANAALDLDEEGKRDIRALCMKAEALYQKGDFETALVFYHRGNKLRSELQEFRLGIQKCQEAIDNSIGSPSSVKLEASGDLSYFYKQEEKQKQQKGYTKINQPQRKNEKRERTRPKDETNSKTTKELLGQLYQDKEYLEKLFDSLAVSGSQTDDYIKHRACDGIEYLKGRSDFWLQQKPMYARKRERERQSRSSRGRINNPEKYVMRRLEKIDEAFAAGQYNESLEKSKETLKKMEEFPQESFSSKAAFEASLQSCMGNAYFELERYSEALACHEKDLQISRANKIEEAESRALDNMGRTHAKLGNFNDAIEIWSKKLPLSKSPLESTWLYHEIGRCHLELGDYQEAKDYGEKAIAAAKEADDPAWILHAYVLTAQSEVKCGELEAATDSFTRALELAEEQNDVSGQTAIKRALEEVNGLIVKGEQEEGEGQQEESEDKEDKASDKEETAKDSPGTKTKGGATKGGATKGGARNGATKGAIKGHDDDASETDSAHGDDKKEEERGLTFGGNSSEGVKGEDTHSVSKKSHSSSSSSSSSESSHSESDGEGNRIRVKRKRRKSEKREITFADSDDTKKDDTKNESKA